MYLDESIDVGKLPEIVGNAMKEADSFYHNDDDCGYMNALDCLEGIIHQAHSIGYINDAQVSAIYKRYGWGWM